MRTVAVNAVEFMPYLGFWNRMLYSDIFVLTDTTKFRHRHYQNRNRIRTSDGWAWFSVPVNKEHGVPLRDVILRPAHEMEKCWAIVEANYRGRAQFWDTYIKDIKDILRSPNLFDMNMRFIEFFKNLLEIRTETVVSSKITNLVSEDSLTL
jgi:hypothetical protein